MVAWQPARKGTALGRTSHKLAIDGGERACPGPLPAWPCYADDEIEAVADILRSGKVNQWTGDRVTSFETAFARTFGQPHAVAVANGTLALELALTAAGIGPGDEVIVSPRSFIASASCVLTRGATPVFADVDMNTQNITASTIEAVASPRTRAIIPVHLNGHPCDMPAIMALADRLSCYVIEDCAQAHGAKIDGSPVGSFGHAAAFSFCQDKIMSTGGEGGMVLFRDKEDYRRAWSHKDHGKSYDAVFHGQHAPGFRWLHEMVGSNWRMTEMQAAIGLKQLEKLPEWHTKRQSVAIRFAQCLAPFDAVDIPQTDTNIEHAWYRFSFKIEEERLKPEWDHIYLMAAINAEGVSCLEVCPEIYREKTFSHCDIPEPDCPNAAALGKQVLQLQVHPMLDEKALDNICRALTKVLEQAL